MSNSGVVAAVSQHMTTSPFTVRSQAPVRSPFLRIAARTLGAVLVLLLSACLSAPADASVSATPFRPPRDDGAWMWPLWPQPEVAHLFDAPDGPYAAGHRGVDLLGRSGQAVHAVDDGTVAYAGRVGGIGVVTIDTAAGRVTYQPVAASVRRGAVVHAGTVLGHLLTAGGHCLPRACLHLGLLVAGEYRDPLSFLGGGPVRLLPLIGAATGPPPVSPETGPDGGPVSPRSRAFLSPPSAAGGVMAARLGLSVAGGLAATTAPSTTVPGERLRFPGRSG